MRTASYIKTKKMEASELSSVDIKEIRRASLLFDKITIRLARIATQEYLKLIKSRDIHAGRGLGSHWHTAAHILHELKKSEIFGA